VIGAAVPLVSWMLIPDCQQNSTFTRPQLMLFTSTDVGFVAQVMTRLTGFGVSAALKVVVCAARIDTGVGLRKAPKAGVCTSTLYEPC
jgi:hypothetical protein